MKRERLAGIGRLESCLPKTARTSGIYPLAFFFAQRAFIMTDSFFRIAGLIGLRAEAFLGATGAFFVTALPFCLAHRALCAAAILARAAELIRRRPPTGLAWLDLGGRPRPMGFDPSPARAAIACSIR